MEEKTMTPTCSPGTMSSVTGSQAGDGVISTIRDSQGIFLPLCPARGSGAGGGSGSVLDGQ